MGRKSRSKHARRVEKGEQGPNPSYIGDEFVFTEHVPEGMLPCDWCCRHASGLAVKAGYFRDFDVDVGASRFGVCPGCAGTGVAIGLSRAEGAEISRCRSARDQRTNTLSNVVRAYARSSTLVGGREFPRRLLDRALVVLDGSRIDAEGENTLFFAADVIDSFFVMSEPAETLNAALRSVKSPGDLAAIRERIVRAASVIDALLPSRESAAGDRLAASATAVFPPASFEQELQLHRAWLDDPLPYEEWKLLLLVHWYWVQAGRPHGCYAEELVEQFRNVLTWRPPEYRSRVGAAAIARFEPKDVPPELAGCTAELLADLHDCIAKFGMEDRGDHVRRGSLDEPSEVHVTVSTDPERLGIVIIGPGGETAGKTHVFLLAEGRHLILWDGRVTVEHVRAFIARVDEMMAKRGLVDATTGARTAVVSDCVVPSKDSVDRVFATPGVCIPVLPGGPDAETMRQRFDRPEEVGIMNDLGGPALYRVRDLPYIKHRQRVAERVLARHGITPTAEAMA
ncbi:hypothetical protein HY480_03050 [Candidatus Uhrbacteria bacterium]|nr:hypothetical protein [Candidatus Uhrbacteria bacterium]